MNKQVIKWTKRITITVVTIGIVITSMYFYYNKVYLPNLYSSLYEEGLSNLNKADSIAKELENLHQSQLAIELVTYAARKGIVKSQTKLAFYMDVYKHDLEKSSYWYLQAAQNGDSDAQCQLGINYIYGFGVRQNFNKAIYWIKKSADNNNSEAQYELGDLYLNGLAYYDLDYNHTDYWYVGNNTFIGLDNIDYKASNRELEEILSNPKIVFLVPSLTTAKYYWTLSAKQGYKEAKDALEKIYD